MRAGREPGGADVADHLSLADLLARVHAAGEGRHVAIGGLVTVGVTDADVLAVAAFPTDLVDDAIARGEDRRAHGGAPIHAGMHLAVAEQRMVAAAEAGRDVPFGHRLAHQEFLRALAAVVIVVDDIVVGGLVAIEFSGLAAGRQQSEQHFGLGVSGVLVVARVQDLEGIAGLNLALEIDVIRVNADEIVDHRAGHVIA